ncbi:hypothetical protein B0H14DRAFT_3700941 [Mycena olivaceomarginata]|nr:hypothetical protein B0H14DRAFT_3700941 [Mycena olivaceomarginata]
MNVLVPILAALGIITIIWPFCGTVASLSVISVLFGVTLGAYGPLTLVPVAAMGGTEDLGRCMGTMTTILGIGDTMRSAACGPAKQNLCLAVWCAEVGGPVASFNVYWDGIKKDKKLFQAYENYAKTLKKGVAKTIPEARAIRDAVGFGPGRAPGCRHTGFSIWIFRGT